MANSGLYVVVYDISDDKERESVSNVLGGYGFRVQRSVFECRLTVAARGKMLGQLEELGLKTGFVYAYRVLGKSKRLEIGTPPEDEAFSDDQYAYII